MSELSDALGRGTKCVFGGETLTVEALDFNDLCELEEFSGIDADELDISAFLHSTKNKRFFLWLVLRKSDPRLTDEEREAGAYQLTEMEAGRKIKFGSDVEQLTLVNLALGLSGLVKEKDKTEEDNGEADPKPEPATPATPQPQTKRKNSAPASSSPS